MKDLLESPAPESDPLIDLDAERAVLGAILFTPESIHAVAWMLSPESFGDPRHALVWRAMEHIAMRGHAIDLHGLNAELLSAGRMNVIGGAMALYELTERTSSAAHIDLHAEIVAERSRQRMARERLAVLATRARDVTVSSSEIEALTNAATLDLCGPRRGTSVCTGSEAMDALMTDLDRPLDETPGIPTPTAALTRVTGGWHPGQLIVVAARPSVGKTAYTIQAILAAAEAGHGALLCSLETRRLPLARRMVAAFARCSLDAVSRRRAQTDDEAQDVLHAASTLARMPITLDDAPHQSLASIRGVAHRLKAQGKLSLLAIDYLGLVATTSRRDGTREREVAELARGLKVLAGDLMVPVILLAQLNRDVEKAGREPRLSDLRESGAIEQDADVVLFLHREGDSNDADLTEEVTLIVAKQRDGARGAKLKMIYRKSETRFYDAEPLPTGATIYRRADAPPSHYDTDADDFGAPLGDAE